VRAIEQVLAANPAVRRPVWLTGPAGTRFVAALAEEDIDAAVALVADEYWNKDVPLDRLAAAMRGSTALVGARDSEGRLVATARAISDGSRNALVCDVAVAREQRGRGIGKALVGLLLDHPALRDVDRVRLHTRDAQRLYAKLGFIATLEEQREFPSTEMIRRRA
jgi:ribosomal protein S18 acetylase RimI-like enzyme